MDVVAFSLTALSHHFFRVLTGAPYGFGSLCFAAPSSGAIYEGLYRAFELTGATWTRVRGSPHVTALRPGALGGWHRRLLKHQHPSHLHDRFPREYTCGHAAELALKVQDRPPFSLEDGLDCRNDSALLLNDNASVSKLGQYAAAKGFLHNRPSINAHRSSSMMLALVISLSRAQGMKLNARHAQERRTL